MQNDLGPWDFRVQLGPKLRRTMIIVGTVALAWLIIQTIYVLISAMVGG